MSSKITIARLTNDLKSTIKWYKKNFDASIVFDNTNLATFLKDIYMRDIKKTAEIFFGNESILFIEVDNFALDKQFPKPNSPYFQHIAIIVEDIKEIYNSLLINNVKIKSKCPQTIPFTNKIAGGIKVLYLYDNLGYPIALVEYPKDKGKEKWHKNRSLIKGIDHTAMVVKSLDNSINWYKQFGFYMDIKDIRFGIEQENLTNLKSAKVKLISMEGAKDYVLELIEYMNPKSKDQIKSTYLNQLTIIDTNRKLKPYLMNDPSGHKILVN